MSVHTNFAKRHFANLQDPNSKFEPEHSARKVREWLESGGATFADINTSNEELQVCLRQAQVAKATKMVVMFRANPKCTYSYIQNYLMQAGLTHADAGTSEEELKQLAATHELDLARHHLQKLRVLSTGQDVVGGSVYHLESHIKTVQVRVRRAGSTLQAIGTTSQELGELREQAWKNTALMVLSRLREGVYKHDDQCMLEHCITTGALSLKELNTTEAEIALLSAEYTKNQGKDMLRRARAGKALMHRSHSTANSRYMRKWLAETGLSPEEIGTSEEELAQLV